MPSYKRSKSQKKNGGSRNRSRSTRSAKRGGRRATKSSRGGQRAKKSVMQRGGGVISWDELGAKLAAEKELNNFYVAWGIFPGTTWDVAVETVIKKEITNFNRDSVDVAALLELYKNKGGTGKYVIQTLESLI